MSTDHVGEKTDAQCKRLVKRPRISMGIIMGQRASELLREMRQVMAEPWARIPETWIMMNAKTARPA